MYVPTLEHSDAFEGARYDMNLPVDIFFTSTILEQHTLPTLSSCPDAMVGRLHASTVGAYLHGRAVSVHACRSSYRYMYSYMYMYMMYLVGS